jgi:DNA-directed RNA polymerase specialized sigma24 family protein
MRRIDPAIKEQAVALYREGLAGAVIAQRLDFSAGHVRFLGRQAGVAHPMGAPRRCFRPHLELRPQDYRLLEAAAVNTLNSMGFRPVSGQTCSSRSGRWWNVEDLIAVGWESVFRYAKTYEYFEQYGYLHCLQQMRRHLCAATWRRQRELWVQGEYTETHKGRHAREGTPRFHAGKRTAWECLGCGYVTAQEPSGCPKCSSGSFWQFIQFYGETIPDETPAVDREDVTSLLNGLSREELALVYERFWRGRTHKMIARNRGVTGEAIRKRMEDILQCLRLRLLVRTRREDLKEAAR